MRDVSLIPAVIALALVAASPAWAQYAYPFGLDPYKPTDAAFLRDYGGTLVAQTPLLELRKLDPYVPSHAALIRQIGALPLWWGWYGRLAPGRAAMSSRPFASTGGVAGDVASLSPTFVGGEGWLTPALPLPGQPRLDQIPRREVREDRASTPGR